MLPDPQQALAGHGGRSMKAYSRATEPFNVWLLMVQILCFELQLSLPDMVVLLLTRDEDLLGMERLVPMLLHHAGGFGNWNCWCGDR